MKRKSNILIVDDKVNVRETVKNILEGLEISYLEAGTGEDALNLIRNEEIDLIILDIRLPGISGIETFREARKINPSLPPVIILTGYGDIEPAVEAGKLGVFDYLIKDPLPYEQLRDTVTKVLSWKSQIKDTTVKRCFKLGIAECKFEIPVQKGLVFVGMPFSLSDIYRFGIKPAVESLGMKCWHAYEHKKPTDITCKICGSLQAAELAIMDVSNLNPNVFLEIGLAYGYGKIVILLKNENTTMPANLMGMEYVEYSDIGSLKKKLKEFIEVVKS